MATDPAELTEQIQDVYQQVRPAGPFTGVAQGVEVDVDNDGLVRDVVFDDATYRMTNDTDLADAIVAAHRGARELAITAREQAIQEVLQRCGAAEAVRAWPA